MNAFGPIANALGWPQVSLLLVNDADVEQLITQVLHQQSNDYLGVSSIDVDADQDPVHLYGILTAMFSRGIGSTGIFSVKWHHPSGDEFDADVKMIGCHGTITMEGGQAKMTGQIRTALNRPSTTADNVAAVWASGVTYVANQYVTDAGVLYQALSTHLSAAGDEPGVGVNWATYWVLVD